MLGWAFAGGFLVQVFPLAAWLRPGSVGGACGAVEVLSEIVTILRQAPTCTSHVRGS
jgi:hypothetical protein